MLEVERVFTFNSSAGRLFDETQYQACGDLAGVWQEEGVVLSSLGQGVFDDLTPGERIVKWTHSQVQDTFIVDFHHLIAHHHLSQGHFSFFNDDREVFGRLPDLG